MAREPNWIGHPSAQRRMLRDGDNEHYEYLDPENQSLALMLGIPALHPIGPLFSGANLWEVDRFVEGLEANADPDAEEFRAVLDKIRSSFRSYDLSGDIGTSAAWDSLRAHAQTIIREMRSRGRHAVSSCAAVAMERGTPSSSASDRGSPQSSESPSTPLTSRQCTEIVSRAERGEDKKKLAKEYGKSYSYICRLVRDEQGSASKKRASDPFGRTEIRRR